MIGGGGTRNDVHFRYKSGKGPAVQNEEAIGVNNPFIGVHFDQKFRKFKSFIVMHGETTYLGLHKLSVDAARNHDINAKRLLGDNETYNFDTVQEFHEARAKELSSVSQNYTNTEIEFGSKDHFVDKPMGKSMRKLYNSDNNESILSSHDSVTADTPLVYISKPSNTNDKKRKYGHIGVTYDSKTKKYRARHTQKGKRHSFGCHARAIDAARAYKEGMRKLYNSDEIELNIFTRDQDASTLAKHPAQVELGSVVKRLEPLSGCIYRYIAEPQAEVSDICLITFRTFSRY